MLLAQLAQAIWAVPTSAMACGMIVTAVATFFTLLYGPVAPYGRCVRNAHPIPVSSSALLLNAARVCGTA